MILELYHNQIRIILQRRNIKRATKFFLFQKLEIAAKFLCSDFIPLIGDSLLLLPQNE